MHCKFSIAKFDLKKTDIVLWYAYVCKVYFVTLNHLGVTCDGQTFS